MKTWEASRYNLQGCPTAITITGEEIVEAIKEVWEDQYKVEVRSITKTSGGYKINHSGREIIKYENYDKFPATIYEDLVSKITEVENLVKMGRPLKYGEPTTRMSVPTRLTGEIEEFIKTKITQK
jgi:hypothetical protein